MWERNIRRNKKRKTKRKKNKKHREKRRKRRRKTKKMDKKGFLVRTNLVWRNAIRRSSCYRPSRSCQSDYWPQVDPEQAIMSLCHPCRPLSETTLRLWLRSNHWNLSVYELSFQWDSREAVISCLLATIEMESWLAIPCDE